jgi:hypothetical protein
MLADSAAAGGRKPGSVLVYPIHLTGNALFTIICVTNTNPTVDHFGRDSSMNLHYEYVNVIPNPNDPFKPLGCVIFDRVDFVTPADTLCVLTRCHNAFGGVNTQGYVVVSIEDPRFFNLPMSANLVAGSQMVVLPTGAIFSFNAIPFNAVNFPGQPTDTDGDDQLDFDGVEYEEVPEHLILDSFVADSGQSLALINLTGGPTAENTVLFQVWNDNEFPLSSTLTFRCWFHQPLIAISPLFDGTFLANNTPDDPAELDLDCDGIGNLETGWVRIDSILVTTPGGTVIDLDGALLGATAVGPNGGIDGGRLLWESVATQANGQFVDFGQ